LRPSHARSLHSVSLHESPILLSLRDKKLHSLLLSSSRERASAILEARFREFDPSSAFRRRDDTLAAAKLACNRIVQRGYTSLFLSHRSSATELSHTRRSKSCSCYCVNARAKVQLKRERENAERILNVYSILRAKNS